MKHLLIAIFALTFLLLSNCGQLKKEDKTFEKVEQYVSKLEKVGFYGSVLVEIKGERIISKGYGYSDDEKQIKNSPTTIFDIGSIAYGEK